MNLVSSSCGGDSNQYGQEVPKHPDGDVLEEKEDEKPLSGATKKEEKDEDKVVTVTLGICAPATDSPPTMIVKEMEEMFLRLDFSQTVAQKLVDD